MTFFANEDTWAHVESYFTPLERATMAVACKATPKPVTSVGKRMRTVDLAARRGYKGIVKWRKSEIKDSTFIAAAKSGNLKLVKWLKRKKCYCFSSKAVQGAAKHGHLKILKWYAVFASFMLKENVLYKAALHNRLKIIKWFFWLKGGDNFEKVLEIAADKGHDEIFRWCSKRGCQVSEKAFVEILKRGDFSLAKLCVKRAGYLLPNFASAMYAAEGGNLEVLKLCVENGAKIERHYVLSRAIHNEDLIMVKWLVEQGVEVDRYSVENASELQDQTIYNYLLSL